MRLKAKVMDATQIRRALIRMAHEIIEKNRGVANIALVGIQRRGLPIAVEISRIIKAVEGLDVPVGALDITFYRDDFSLVSELPRIKKTDLPFPITGSGIILVDDVLYTGRTVRAAMEALHEAGRPQKIQLAVLIDRGNRELPIGADYVGKLLPTSHNELVSVSVPEIDGDSRVEIYAID